MTYLSILDKRLTVTVSKVFLTLCIDRLSGRDVKDRTCSVFLHRFFYTDKEEEMCTL